MCMCLARSSELQTTTKPTDLYQLQESRLDTIYRRHRVRFRSDHHTHQHTHWQQNFHKHHTDGRTRPSIPKGKMHSNCRLLPEDIVCKITQRNNIRRANTCDPALKLLNEEITSDIQKTQTKHMEGALRRSLGSQAQHTHSLEDHTWSIQQSTTTHTKHIHNIQQQNSNYTHTHCELFSPNNSQTLSSTQHTKQTDTLTEKHTTYKDTTLHSLLLRSKRL